MRCNGAEHLSKASWPVAGSALDSDVAQRVCGPAMIHGGDRLRSLQVSEQKIRRQAATGRGDPWNCDSSAEHNRGGWLIADVMH